MKSFYKPSSCVLLTAAMATVGLPAVSQTFELLTLGDSITFGIGSDSDPTTLPDPDDDLGSYRYFLDDLAGAGIDFDFVGNRSSGSGLVTDALPFTDNQHWGVSSGQAALDTSVPSTLTGIFDAGPGVTSADAAFNSSVTNPDAVLLRIGINSLPTNSFQTPSSGNTTEERILGDVELAVDQFATLLDGDVSRPDGLTSRLTDNTYFADDAHLFVAFITPKANGDTSNPFSTQRTINRKQGVATALYNNGIKDEIESRSGVGGDLEGRVTFVDLFSISLNELDLQALADEFFGGDLVLLDAAINPDDDAADGGLEYVDWIGVDFDEGNYDNGAFDTNGGDIASSTDWEQDLQPGTSTTGDLINANTALMGDGLHLTNLGYAIEAQVWANALNGHFVPEPSAMMLLVGGGMMMAARRRRRA